MKRLSIKAKITLWFTLFMLLLAGLLFVFVFTVSRGETRRQSQSALMAFVSANAGEVEYDDGQIEIDSDFTAYRNGMYCLVYDSEGWKIGGRSPDDELETLPLTEGAPRTVTLGGETYLIYDLMVTDHRRPLFLRGILSDGGGGIAYASLRTAALISVPLLILFAAVGGYLLSGRSLRPIRKIQETAEEIGQSGDLSKRIAIEGNGDELHKLAGTFNRMFDKLETNFEAEKQFASDASHELRTPVTTLLAQCEYALENASGEAELRELIGDMQKQGFRMKHLIESLLSYTRLTQGTASLSLTRTDLSALSREVLEEARHLPEKNITLSENIEEGLFVMADPALMTRLLENLVQNAYRYGKENGTTVVSLSRTGKEIALSVADDGIGIAKEDLPHIWNRFYQAEKSRSRKENPGLGLGLSMVKEIAHLHGGHVKAESTPGEGSVFTVCLPALD